MQSDTEYFRHRAREERHAAERSTDPRVRMCHLEFADAYELRLREMYAGDRRPVFHIVATGPFIDLHALGNELMLVGT